jgi:fibro-slime domain-containing protein
MKRHLVAHATWLVCCLIVAIAGCKSNSGNGAPAGGPVCAPAVTELNLPIDIRDFSVNHPDMEAYVGIDPGIVETSLGTDGKPVYANPGGSTDTTTGQTEFDQWYRDVDGANILFPQVITLSESLGVFQYASSAFFPIDGLGFGNEAYPHNYHFTTEVRFQFRYNGAEVINFTGDDDFWAFVNDTLTIDLGGVHAALSGAVDLGDAPTAASLGLVDGQIYEVAIFQAERHTTQSNYTLTLAGFAYCSGP